MRCRTEKCPGLVEGQIFVKHLVDWTLTELGLPPSQKAALDAPKSHHPNDLSFHCNCTELGLYVPCVVEP